MARGPQQQSTTETTKEQFFTDIPNSSPSSVFSSVSGPEQPPPPPPSPSPIEVTPPNPPATADPSDFFLSCLDSVEQQRFLDFCANRRLEPTAGILLFMKEPLQRYELNPLASNPFADEAQAVVDSVRAQTQPQAAAPVATQIHPGVYVGRKPVKPCEVCGTPFEVEFLGRKLCKNETCWHTYNGMSPQSSLPKPTAGSSPETDRRLSKIETMMEWIVGKLEKRVGA